MKTSLWTLMTLGMALALNAFAGDLDPPGAPVPTMQTLDEVGNAALAAQASAEAAAGAAGMAQMSASSAANAAQGAQAAAQAAQSSADSADSAAQGAQTTAAAAAANAMAAASNAAGAQATAEAARLAAVAAQDPRTLIDSLPFLIDQPGSYALAAPLTLGSPASAGITIDASHVTLDLNGFSLIGPGKGAMSSSVGIEISGERRGVAIINGAIAEWSSHGVAGDAADSGILRDLRATRNGGHGLVVADGWVIAGNACEANGMDGIRAEHGAEIRGNACLENEGNGITARRGCRVAGNTCRFNEADGIEVSQRNFVLDNICDGSAPNSSQAGIHVTGDQNSIIGNSCFSFFRGLDIDQFSNYSSGNFLAGNFTNEDLGGSTEGAGDLANVVGF